MLIDKMQAEDNEYHENANAIMSMEDKMVVEEIIRDDL